MLENWRFVYMKSRFDKVLGNFRSGITTLFQRHGVSSVKPVLRANRRRREDKGPEKVHAIYISFWVQQIEA